MSERDNVAKHSKGSSGIEFKPAADQSSEEILKGQLRIGNLFWPDGQIRVSWSHGMSNINISTLSELEDIVAEAHRVLTDLNPKEDTSFIDRKISPVTPQE